MAEAEAKPPAWLGGARVGIGLLQGLALFCLHRAEMDGYWPSQSPAVFCMLVLVFTFVPFILIGGVNAIRPVTLAAWTGFAAVVLAWIGWHNGASGDTNAHQLWPSPPTMLAGAAIVFIGHHLVAAGDEARAWIAPYERYFDLGWRHAAQLALSVAFTGTLWILLFLGAALFQVIKITALQELIRKDWFAFPVTTMAFASAIHLTDLRSGLVRGFRALSLMLLSWLLPVFALLGAAFLAALPFTGLAPLWETRAAGAILLSAAANFIILINAAYQDGGDETSKSTVLRIAARVSGVLLAPLEILAGVALWLRIEQHGLSPERVLAAVCILVGAVYAGFYAAAAFWRPWMKVIERGNIYVAILSIGLLIALFTPIADPARLSVGDQIARLRSGAVTAAQFDYVFLRFNSGRYGRDALAQLRRDSAGEIATRAQQAQSYDNEWEARRAMGLDAREDASPPVEARGALQLRLLPGSPPLPESFTRAATDLRVPGVVLCSQNTECQAMAINMDEEPGLEVLVRANSELSLFDEIAGEWQQVGRTSLCYGPERSDVREGEIQAVAPLYKEILIGQSRIRLQLVPLGCESFP